MLNIGRMAPGGEDYYLATVADGVEEYYLGKGELPGRWLGSGADTLALSGEVTAEQLRAVLGARDPRDDQPLLVQRQRTVPGFDLTFRAPKSVSLLYGLGNPDAARETRRAHDAAVDAALGYLEREAVWTRRGRGGAERVPTTGAVAAAFMHRTSRAGDPLLHTHVLVANLARAADDGRWRTVDSRRLYAHAKTAGYLYQAHLRDELTHRLGVTWEPVTNGTADLQGIPREVVEAFSQRRAEILDLMERRGETSARAAQVATLETRPAKDEPADPVALRERWATQAREVGFDPAELNHVVHRRRVEPVDVDRLADAGEALLGPDGLTARASTFTRRDVLQAWCDRLPHGIPIARVERLADALLDDEAGAVVALDQPDATVQMLSTRDVIRRPDGTVVASVPDDHRYSTPDLLALEQCIVLQATDRADAGVAVVDDTVVDRVLAARPSIAHEQADMVRRLTRSGVGVEVVVGKAGAGKTYALDAARAAWQTSGHHVVGAALAARAAVELESGAGIDSYTIDRLLADVEHPEHGGFAPQTVLVVDEAGMVGTRKLARLLDAAATDDAKVVLVGDHHQLPEIDAGGVLRGLANRLPTIELVQNRRQVDGWEVDALDHLRDGDVTAGLSAYTDSGRVHVGATVDAAREQLVGDWWHARTVEKIDGVMVALRRSDVDDLNARARQRMAAAGALQGPEVAGGGRSFQVGDRVVCLRNNRRLDVVNGTRGNVIAVDPETRTLTVQPDDDDRMVELPTDYLDARNVDHAYAITGHKAQGLTTVATWVLGADAMYREWGYVALSRGRRANHLYLVADPEPNAAAHDAVMKAADPIRRLVGDLRRSRGQHFAIDQADTEFTKLTDHQLRVRLDTLRTKVIDAANTGQQDAVQRLKARGDELTTKVHDLAEQLEANERGRRQRRREPNTTARLRTQLKLHERQLDGITSGLAHAQQQSEAQGDVDKIGSEFERADLELHRRATRRARAVAIAPTAPVAEALGRRPDSPATRRRWSRAVAAVEHYRAAWDVEGGDLLGPLPRDLAQRRHHDAVQNLVRSVPTPPPDRSEPRAPTRGSQWRELA